MATVVLVSGLQLICLSYMKGCQVSTNVGDAPIHILSLCSGIAGLDLGVQLAVPRSRIVGYVEANPYCAAILLARMEEKILDPAPVWCGDIKEFDGSQWYGSVDLITAGYP